MNILLLGNGAREHVLANLIKKSRHQPKLFVYASAKNPGIYKMAEEYYIGDICDTESVCEFAKTNNITLAIIGPENPLDAGIVDELRKVGIDAFAPTKALAQLETSKGFTRNLLEKYGVKGNPGFRAFELSESPVISSEVVATTESRDPFDHQRDFSTTSSPAELEGTPVEMTKTFYLP